MFFAILGEIFYQTETEISKMYESHCLVADLELELKAENLSFYLIFPICMILEYLQF